MGQPKLVRQRPGREMNLLEAALVSWPNTMQKRLFSSWCFLMIGGRDMSASIKGSPEKTGGGGKERTRTLGGHMEAPE